MTSDFLASTGATAFAAGDWSTARARFDERVMAGQADAETFAMLASACLRLDDPAAAHAAAESAVRLQAHNLRAVLVKAELLTAEGDLRTANFYNGLALQIAEAAPVPPDLAPGVARARQARDYVHANMLTLIQDELRVAGYSERSSHPRFRLALDILTGRRQPYFQQPTRFYYPELANIQFFPRRQFPWLDALEAATDDMARELEAVLHEDAAFTPYMRQVPNMPASRDPLTESLDWSTCFLIWGGKETPVAARCPRTMAALAGAPLPYIKGSSPDVLFSQLRAGAHILPHTGAVNTRLICHVPLIVPPGCHFRVGNETRQWEKGKAWVFDDTIEHEAWNNSNQTRVVLILDVWRPELDEEERALVSTLFESMYAYAPDRAP